MYRSSLYRCTEVGTHDVPKWSCTDLALPQSFDRLLAGSSKCVRSGLATCVVSLSHFQSIAVTSYLTYVKK